MPEEMKQYQDVPGEGNGEGGREHEGERDHRELGRELGIFMYSPEVGAGLPLWLPRGAVLRESLENFLRQQQIEHGYQHVITPSIGKVGLYKTSGHWYKYRDSIYPPMIVRDQNEASADERSGWNSSLDSCCGHALSVGEDEDVPDDAYILRPMNCPHHIEIYKHELRSYRSLPLRLAEFGSDYRYEQSGEINGLLRTRNFTQDDEHIFAAPEQLEDEFVRVIEMTLFVFKALGLNDFSARFGLRDPASSKYVGSDEVWERAQGVILRALERLGLSYVVAEGEAGFYAPKLDFLVRDSLGRQWQLGTAQVDFNLPERFDLSYIGEDGQPHRPAIIHHANVGSLERVVGILLEHYAGALPVWLAPVQAVLIPIADRHLPYAQQVVSRVRAAGVRVELDSSGERMNAKIRKAQMQKIPYMLIVGDKEAAEQSVSVRLRNNENLGAMPLADFIKRITRAIADRSGEL
jgi:threonyl-tRNA synthetase